MNDDLPEPANLTFLRRLVTVLTATMILGLVVLIGLVVIRMQGTYTPPVWLPSQITLPSGVEAQAVTYGSDWYLVVTQDDRILVFDQVTSELMHELPIRRN